MVWPAGNVQAVVQPLTSEELALVTVTEAWKPPAHELVVVRDAVQPPVVPVGVGRSRTSCPRRDP